SYYPISTLANAGDDTPLSLAALGQQAQAIFDGQTQEVLGALIAAGSSGGARPKAQVYFAGEDFQYCRTRPTTGDSAGLVKFTSADLPLGHEEGRCEAVYLRLAAKAGLQVPNWRLLPVEGGNAPTSPGAWLALERFDRVANSTSALGRRHL